MNTQNHHTCKYMSALRVTARDYFISTSLHVRRSSIQLLNDPHLHFLYSKEYITQPKFLYPRRLLEVPPTPMDCPHPQVARQSMGLERQQRSSTSGGHSPSTDYPQNKHTMQDPCNEAFEYEDAELRTGYSQFELPLVAYARLHELTADYRTQHPLAFDLCPVLPADWKFDLNDPEGAPNINLLVTLGGLNGNTAHEKLDIGKDAAELLSSVFRLAQSGDSIDEFMCDFAPPFRDLKLEEPMLMSDAEVDLMRLIRRNTATISSDGMKPFPEDEIQDPGFLGRQEDAAMFAGLEEHANEKLDIDRSTMEYLIKICNQLSLDGDGDMETDLVRRKVI